MATTQAGPFTGRTAWVRNIAAPVREFLATETGSAAALLGATVLALLWANSAWWDTYESVWTTRLAITLGDSGLSGRPAPMGQRRADDVLLPRRRPRGQARARHGRAARAPPPRPAGLRRARRACRCPVAIYLAFNAGGPAAHGWGAAMSTDTAFALGVLALVAPRGATRLRVFLLTLAVVDDLVALLVIATVYSAHVVDRRRWPSRSACSARCWRCATRRWRRSAAAVVIAAVMWVALLKSGVRPGHRRAGDRARDQRLPAVAQRPRAGDRAGARVSRAADARARALRAAQPRSRRSPPTSACSTGCTRGPATSSSRSSRWPTRGSTSTGGLLGDALHSPVTLGIFFAYVVGKPLGVVCCVVAGQPAGLRWPAPLDQLAGARRGGHRRRHRLHGLAADLEPGLPRRARSTRRSSASSRARSRRRSSPGRPSG